MRVFVTEEIRDATKDGNAKLNDKKSGSAERYKRSSWRSRSW